MIAIVLINYNNKKDTIDCVKSIQRSKYIKPPFVVVIDNHSSEEIAMNDFNFYNDIKIIYNKENIGFGKANNIGVDWILDNLKSNYIFILNNDTEIKDDTLHNLIENFPNDKETVVVSPKILTFEKKPRIWYGGGSFNYGRISVNVNCIGEFNKELESKYVDFISGCAMFFKTEYLVENQLFDPKFFMYDEDLELCLKLNLQQKKIYFINESVVFHKCQGSQKENTKKEINQLHPNNQNLIFYLSLTIPNRYYIIKKYFFGFDRVTKQFNLSFYFLGKSIQYLLYGNARLMLLTIRLIIKSHFLSTK